MVEHYRNKCIIVEEFWFWLVAAIAWADLVTRNYTQLVVFTQNFTLCR